MKQFYILICLLFSTNFFAQDITPEIDTKLQLLDKNYIITDILYDRVFPLANLVEFNQISSDTSHINHFYRAYSEIQTADYTNRWGTLQTFKANAENETSSIPIGIINVDFEYMDEEAISDNLLDIQGQDSLLVDVPNRPRSPYIKTKALVISPLTTDTKSITANFKLDNSFNIQGSNITIQSLQADFGNGQGYQSLSLSGQKSVTFNSTGLHNLKFKVTFSNGSVKYTYAKIRVNSSPSITKISENDTKSRTTTEFCYDDIITASRGFQGYDETIAYKGLGEFTVYKGGSFYDKPIIVLDGFDPFEGTDKGVDATKIYSQFLSFNGGSSNLGSNLRNQGFDIIPLNFINGEQNDGSIIKGGTDYIERNAMVLVELIERINTSSCWSNVQPIKVIGFSMGGLIGRYALRYMEQNNIPHNADLFISIDSPIMAQ
ncbi:alpha/beta hydrolase [Antarcticibacterium arcticum]|uniref:Alpha/beta hydrolase n=1 Tax=Antarcticibacterium arcticum TaxID=2585771 RepID=A0A5B8YHD7_9FLAO|nr:alpha/beta hydrolase [Antarcticibacterium arcticum]QED37001.1 alpha/beta hydrolase [Antarcticibacterium arcticum]